MATKKTTSTTTKSASTKASAAVAGKPSSSVITTAKAPAAAVASKGAIRNTALPRSTPIARIVEPTKEITFDMIARRAYEIHCSGTGGSQDDNWFRAERELRAGR